MALRLLQEHRDGLTMVARALVEKETIDGSEVGRLVDQVYGRPVHDVHAEVPTFAHVDAANGHDPEATPGEAPLPTVPLPGSDYRQRPRPGRP